MKYVLAGLLAVSVVSLIAAMFTSVGFPYRADPASPTRQRLVVHVCYCLCHSFDRKDCQNLFRR